jgi:hypothetical protein
MPGPSGFGGSTVPGRVGGVGDAPDVDTARRDNVPRMTIPDFLRPFTVTQFAQYQYTEFTGGPHDDIVILPKNPARVGALFVAGPGLGGDMGISPVSMPRGYNLFTLQNNQSAIALLTSLLSLVTDGWLLAAGFPYQLVVCEFTRQS